MNYFLDTEFIEAGSEHPLVLLSIGLVDENGSQYYAEVENPDLTNCGDWVKQNVLPHFTGPKKSRAQIAADILEFMPPASKPRIWGYFADYDWVLFAQLFGKMVDLPKGFPYFCLDLKQLADMLGVKRDRFPKQSGVVHNGLQDALWCLELFKFLTNESKP